VSDFLQVDYEKCAPEDFMEITLSGNWKLNAKNRSSLSASPTATEKAFSERNHGELDLKASGAWRRRNGCSRK